MANPETIKLFIDEPNELSFDLTIEGSELGKPSVRTIIEGNRFELMFPTDKREEGWSVTIPPLQEVISTGVHNMRLEVVLNNKIFTPLTLTTEFSKSHVVEAKIVTKKPVVESTSVKAAVVKNVTAENRAMAVKPPVVQETVEPVLPVVTPVSAPVVTVTTKPKQEQTVAKAPISKPKTQATKISAVPTLDEILKNL